MWPFNTKKRSPETLAENLVAAIGASWQADPSVTALLSNAQEAYRFTFSSYILGVYINDTLERLNDNGETTAFSKEVFTELMNRYPRADESVRVGDIIPNIREQCDIPEFLEPFTGIQATSEACVDFILSTGTLLAATFFMRRVVYDEGLSELKGKLESTIIDQHHPLFMLYGTKLSLQVFHNDLNSITDNSNIYEVSLERYTTLSRYCYLLFKMISSARKKNC